jgi:uncharacterized protein
MSGTVVELWRYPVKSLQGRREQRLTLRSGGADGDRAWGLLDVATGGLSSAKRFARLLDAQGDDDQIVLPDGTRLPIGDHATDTALSAWLDREVIVVPAEPLLVRAPIHLLTTATLAHCRGARPDLDWDVRRFRPNVVLDTDTAPFAEDEWAGRELVVGSAVLRVQKPTMRCAVPLRAQPGGLARQPGLAEAMTELHVAHPNHLGLNVAVAEPGTIAEGDPVTLR